MLLQSTYVMEKNFAETLVKKYLESTVFCKRTVNSILVIFHRRTYITRDHLGDTGLDGRIILRWIFRKWDVGVWTGPRWLRIETGGGHL